MVDATLHSRVGHRSSICCSGQGTLHNRSIGRGPLFSLSAIFLGLYQPGILVPLAKLEDTRLEGLECIP